MPLFALLFLPFLLCSSSPPPPCSLRLPSPALLPRPLALLTFLSELFLTLARGSFAFAGIPAVAAAVAAAAAATTAADVWGSGGWGGPLHQTYYRCRKSSPAAQDSSTSWPATTVQCESPLYLPLAPMGHESSYARGQGGLTLHRGNDASLSFCRYGR